MSQDPREPNTTSPEDSVDSPGTLALGVAANGDLRWAVVDLGGPLEDARRRLDLSPISAVALGRSLAAAALIQRFSSKSPSRLLVEVRGDGPLGKILAEVDSEGRLRGLVGDPRLATPDDGGLSIGWAVGQGLLKVTREEARGRYTSQVELSSGEIGEDLVHFLEQSQQIRSAALLGVLPDSHGVKAAGGLLIEAFPGVPDEIVGQLEANISRLPGIGSILAQGGVEPLLEAVLEGFDREELERHPLVYRCRCSVERLRESMMTLSKEDLDRITSSDGTCVAVCSFCGSEYHFERGELGIH